MKKTKNEIKIQICGGPGTGKSYVAQIVVDALISKNIHVKEVADDDFMTPHAEKVADNMEVVVETVQTRRSLK